MATTIQRRRGRRAIAATAIAPLLALAGAGMAQADSAPLTWTFDKCAVSSTTWEGTATGLGATVPLRTELTGGWESAHILHVTFDWEVGDLYLARLEGTLNQQTGAVVMNGTVAEGDHAGSRVHEEGQLYDADRGCFAGTITVLPAT
ncbi:MAG TPA: hypothetical protein VFY88_04500 [Intrasporangium sp.]|nr:hypothetical protein [Intrasporangium sp.]